MELELEWLDRMQRAVNPLPQRMALYWHRHWVISTNDGSVSDKWAFAYRNQLLEYSDFGKYPNASFKQLAYDMTTKSAAMSSYLNLNANTKTKPNENYAREIMELFCLGPKDAAGNDNYTQADIVGVTQSLHGLAAQRHRVPPGRRHAEPGLRQDHVRPGQFPHGRPRRSWAARSRPRPGRRTRRPTRTA